MPIFILPKRLACVNKDLKSILNLLQLSLPSPYLSQMVIFLDTVSVQVKK